MTPQNQLSTPKPKRGDVILVPFPNSNLQSAKVRPALVVQADNLNTGLSQLIVPMISSNLSRSGHPSRVIISPSTASGRQSGLLTTSVVLTDNLATIATNVVLRVIGTIPMTTIDAALRTTLGL
ncbi:MAG: type II toxin-antitoxin system PemK/MazF family toxin [Acidobacteria bacterium]|nr:type II toxin-antitoxin system PemK/MazF family toxin [Acidobacteriota bacterium]